MKSAISAMMRSNQNLLQMVNNLLEVYRFEAGKKTLQMESCNMGLLVEEVAQELSSLAMEKGLGCECRQEQVRSTRRNCWCG
jgi:signal transduction histidine kinase